ncbi:hypothetical protein F5I97DRAFT_1923379 [Phlebopus sp. FC_14]|nr:hypothetical protein F5I97DRAFT_1923379 [Phlebopus sp. FC_14]
MLESTDAASPFNHPKADIILRSSDNIDFRIFKLFLSLASPFFESLFELPQPDDTGDQETKDGLIVIPVTENSTTLDTLLRFCYPCTLAEDPCLDQLNDILDVLEAAQKYSLHAIERKVAQAICNPKVLEAEPLRCFAIARRGKLENEALLAAKYTLRQPLIPAWFKEIELITATDLLQLLTYHQKCGNAVQELKRDTSWIVAHYGNKNAWLSDSASSNRRASSCACPQPSTSPWGGGSPPLWWTESVDLVAALTVRQSQAI